MNLIGKKYPRIHSISTVGIRNHNNSDFLIHPMRTDFTGQSGTGKSLVGADIPQLILTAGKFYRSATKPKGNVSRDYNTIPLKDFAYVFMNVEVSLGQFIALGVMIRKSPKQLIPFIIQSNMGIHVEKNYKFRSSSHIIRFKDFIVDNEILSLENLKDHLEKNTLYLTGFYHNISTYHKLLNINKIIHLDLSLDENLQRQYAHTLQSLARGEDIDTSGIKFKKFLFHYDDEVAEKFKSQSQAIEEDHNKFLKDWEVQNTLSKKRDAMSSLLVLKKLKVQAYEQRLQNETIFYFQQKQLKEKELKKITEQLYRTDLEIIVIKERRSMIEVELLEKDKEKKIEELETQQRIFEKAEETLHEISKELEIINEIIEILENEKDELKVAKDRITLVKNWIHKYGTVQEVKRKFFSQKEISIQKEKYQQLISFLKKKGLLETFGKSEYCKSIKKGVEFYSRRKEEIINEIEDIKKLQEIILKQNTDSLAGWAVKEEVKLTELQESVLFHFAQHPTKFAQASNYIPDPETFLFSLQKAVKTEVGFVIDLAGLFYHIEKRDTYIFNDPKKLKTELERIGKDFQVKIEQLNIELMEIGSLDQLFEPELGFSEEHLKAYLNHDTNKIIGVDSTLSLTEDQFVNALESYEKDVILEERNKVETRYNEKVKFYGEKLGRKNTGEENKLAQNQILAQSKNLIEELSKEIEAKNSRIGFLRKTELLSIESKIIFWKSSANAFKEEQKDQLINQFKLKYKNHKNDADLIQLLVDLSKDYGAQQEGIKAINIALPALIENFSNRNNEFLKYFKTGFDEEGLHQIVSEEDLKAYKIEESNNEQKYQNRYLEIVELFKESLFDNPKMKNHYFDLNMLILELIPHEIISNKELPEESLIVDIEQKLAALHLKIKELNKEEAKRIYNTVQDLKRIVQQQTTFLDLVKAMLKDFKLASHLKVVLEWDYSTDFNLSWIDALRNDVHNLNFSDNLFGEKSNVSAQELLEKTFKRYCPTRLDAKAHEILNPFNYYTASAFISDPNGIPSPGSSGQNYGMLALLCISKLSIVEGKTKALFDNIEPGIRILTIDEVAGLGQNFNMLYEIAQRLDYQIFTMTISANDLSFEDGKQIYYEFIPNSNSSLFDYNEGTQACFSKEHLIDDIETYFSDANYNLNSK